MPSCHVVVTHEWDLLYPQTYVFLSLANYFFLHVLPFSVNLYHTSVYGIAQCILGNSDLSCLCQNNLEILSLCNLQNGSCNRRVTRWSNRDQPPPLNFLGKDPNLIQSQIH